MREDFVVERSVREVGELRFSSLTLVFDRVAIHVLEMASSESHQYVRLLPLLSGNVGLDAFR